MSVKVKADASEQSVGACGQAGAGLALACGGGASDTGRWALCKCKWEIYAVDWLYK